MDIKISYTFLIRALYPRVFQNKKRKSINKNCSYVKFQFLFSPTKFWIIDSNWYWFWDYHSIRKYLVVVTDLRDAINLQKRMKKYFKKTLWNYIINLTEQNNLLKLLFSLQVQKLLRLGPFMNDVYHKMKFILSPA